MIQDRVLEPQRLVGRRISFDDAVDALVGMDGATGKGVTVVARFQAG